MSSIVFLAALPPQRDLGWPAPAAVLPVDQYALNVELLHGTQVLVTTMHQDQRWLKRQGALVRRFLEAGGTLIVQGQVAIPFLKELRPFQPMHRPRLEDYTVETLLPDHPLFDGVDPRELNCRRGVAGFYTRGSNPPPPEATVLSAAKACTVPVDWVLPIGEGRLFMHSGNDLWTTFHDQARNDHFTGNLLSWAISRQERP